ncbi:hypothetical protein HDU82_000166 [Entophlyctis luteolus]|nr:hypothetical protein HDU82_000166 [Entophlyctis luteolus]
MSYEVSVSVVATVRYIIRKIGMSFEDTDDDEVWKNATQADDTLQVDNEATVRQRRSVSELQLEPESVAEVDPWAEVLQKVDEVETPVALEFADPWTHDPATAEDDSASGAGAAARVGWGSDGTSTSASLPSTATSRSRVIWRRICGKFVPPDAIPLGRDTDGAPLFATRAPYMEGVHVGKAHNGAGCYISYGGKEILLPESAEYEVLCGHPSSIEWIPSMGKLSRSLVASSRLIESGFEPSGPQFIGKCETYLNGTPVGKCGPELSGLHYPFGGKEIVVTNYRVAAYAVEETPEADMTSLSSEQHSEESAVYWRSCSIGQIPDDAIRLGRDFDGTPFYGGRAKVSGGGVQVGKITSAAGCSIGYGGKELKLRSKFEILCGDSTAIDWVEVEGPVSLMKLAEWKPVEAGEEANGMPLYIGIHEAFGAIQVGKCSPRLPGCAFGHGGKEHSGKKYRMVVYH